MRSDKYYKPYMEYTVEQNATSLLEWQTLVPGIYPSSKSDFLSNSSFTMCPISTIWTFSPAITDFTASNVIINVFPLSISCTDSLEFGLVSSTVSSPDMQIPTNDIIVCSHVTSTPNRISMNCDIVSAISSSDSYAAFNVVWRQTSGSDSNTYTLLQNVALINVTNSLNPPLPASTSCGVNDKLSGSSCNDDSTRLCEVYNGNYTCFGSDLCITNDVYSYPYCGSSCDPYSTIDANGNCCNVNSMDCFGICDGTARQAWFPGLEVGVCCAVSDIDCLGVCHGSADYDVCGTCDGSKTNVLDCPDPLLFSVEGVQSTIINQVFDVRNELSAVVNSTLTLTNNNDTWAMVWLDVEGNDVTVGTVLVPTVPDITLPWTSFNLSAHASVTFNLTGSLSRLFENTNDKLTWGIKTLQLKYRRVGYAIDRGNSTISMKIYPASKNCDTYSKSKKTCARFPGCYFCVEYNDNRVVRSRRKLYTSIVPRMAGELEYDEYQGDCTAGFDPTACQQVEGYVTSRSVSAAAQSPRASLSQSALTCALVICLLFVCL